MIGLCVNVDHVATIRQARRGEEPDPVHAALLVELAGGSGITVHLREDRRHIQDRDVELLRRLVKTKLNLEMAATDEMIEIALAFKPEMATLVPERREELTTEGGLDVHGHADEVGRAVRRLREGGILVSLFIDPEHHQVSAAARAGADFIELHTGSYAEAKDCKAQQAELTRLIQSATTGRGLGLRINAGHGLDYRNVGPVAAIPEVEELSIGHSIIARAVLVGLERAVREMLAAMAEGRAWCEVQIPPQPPFIKGEQGGISYDV
ncbi:pyridoxine 5'-phosphate synthase [Candidatus Methylomirabilis lanthanidiphila]|uniref:Pyridoxine 5'-phosphate synthase n=1 Tax=Candidatus Methylomirabilis lanthanidiphila TaxID=2211376 RepID=A0A564ZJV8_9BACT|nr:pyridoxine 5'-phosphate synthase [Candidatus Methylomirabilis lanthanidiphila]VUZ84828.1 pyridoxine 5'-phosphate synthase [Candidatus Methylomirabilis lanthanidiphila]